MATTTLAIGNDYLSTTTYVLMKEWRDALHTSVAILDAQQRIHGAGGPKQAGGTRIVQPIGMREHSNPTEMITGYEKIDLSVTDATVPAVFEWAEVIYPIVISEVEEKVNQGDHAVLRLAEVRTRQVASRAKRDFCEQLVQGGVTGWSRWNTLNGVDPAPAAADAFLEENAVGSQGNSVGGVSKTTYSGTTGWQNQVYDAANSFNANGLAGLYDLSTEGRAVSETEDFDVWLFSRACFKNLKRSLSAQERYVDKAELDGGRLVQMWNGTQIDTEYYMPTSGTNTTANPISAYGLSMVDTHVIWDPKGYFYHEPWETVSGEYKVRRSTICIRGQLITRHLGSNGLVHRAETF